MFFRRLLLFLADEDETAHDEDENLLRLRLANSKASLTRPGLGCDGGRRRQVDEEPLTV